MTWTARPPPDLRSAQDRSGASAAEGLLLEAARRAIRQPLGRAALVLHLSRLAAPAPRPHHRRVARAIMQDVAQKWEGQVFALRSGDLVLVCRADGLEAAIGTPSDEPGAAKPVPATILARLLRLDAAEPSSFITVWRLDQDADALLRFAEAEHDRPGPAAQDDDAAAHPASRATSEAGALATLIAKGTIRDLLQRQTAVAVGSAPRLGEPAGAGADTGQGLRPIYHEIGFSVPALEARIRAAGQACADPFLFRHLAGQLDRRTLDVLHRELGRGGPLDLIAGSPGHAPDDSPIHLNLTLDSVLSGGFRELAHACRQAGAAIGIEIAVIEACADPHRFAAASRTVRDGGMTLVLDGVSHLALLLASPAALDPDLLKLEWSPRMADLGAADDAAIRAALAEIGTHRVVLHRAETEGAVRWAVAHGIRRFQGRHVDAMLAASRISACPSASGCTLRQCVERAAATGPAGRSGCANHPLLDAGSAPLLAVALAASPRRKAAPAYERNQPMIPTRR